MDRLGPPAFPAFLTARRPSVTKQYKTANQYQIIKFLLAGSYFVRWSEFDKNKFAEDSI